MPTSYSPAQILRFKREAKSLCLANSLTHSQALDLVAAANGWRNWSLLMKHSQSPEEVGQPWHHFVRTTDAMRLSLRVVPRSNDGQAPSAAALLLVEDISGKFASARNAVSFAIQYMECLLTMPRYRVPSSCVANAEMRCWLPYSAVAGTHSFILVNRRYKPVGSTTKDFVDYAQFGHLALRLTDAQRSTFAHAPHALGYLFGDGCPPWESRAHATAYLARLQALKATLEG